MSRSFAETNVLTYSFAKKTEQNGYRGPKFLNSDVDVAYMEYGSHYQTLGPQTEKALFPNWVRVSGWSSEAR